MNSAIRQEQRYCAHNYAPMPIVLTKAKGVYVWDQHGNRYLDMMSAYSAVSHGHCHPRLVDCLQQQVEQLAIVSRAFYSDRLGPFVERACELTGMERALPMNTGVEAVETGLKAARKWAYEVKGVPADLAEIIVCEGNFHGRTLSVVGFSSEPLYKEGFGPFTPGFKRIPFGDVNALARAITPNSAAFLVEPIQGEGGINVPPTGYLAECAEICRAGNVLLLCDEIQCGLGRSGKLLACMHENVSPDGLMLGKALGGGLLPVSMFLARKGLMDVFRPGDHGSTFGGNPLAAAVGLEALRVLTEENLIERSAEMGEYFLSSLKQIRSPLILEVRGRGLLIGLEIDPALVSARGICSELAQLGILTKETHATVIRFAPPLVITKSQIDWTVRRIRQVIKACETSSLAPVAK